MRPRTTSLTLVALALALWPSVVWSEPQFAARAGLKCMQCHVNPTGGGLRSVYGNIFAQRTLPARRLQTDDAELWTGTIGRHLALGGHVRASYGRVETPNQASTSEFDVEEGRIFLGLAVVPGRLSAYVDEQVAPGNANNLEANLLLWVREGMLYLKAGRLYLPFGWRLEDDNAFVRQASGIGMTVPDNGVELGLESGPWSAQLAVSNGAAGGPEIDSGKQLTMRAEHVRAAWRLGVSANLNDSDAGDRHAYALHGALRTGPIVWLGEADYIDDEGLGPSGRKLLATLVEANWQPRPGNILKLTYENFDPDDDVEEDEQDRMSIVYELTPFEFLQLRIGARVYDGIPQNDLQNREQYFAQLHAFF